MAENIGRYMVASEVGPIPGRVTQRWLIECRHGTALGHVQWLSSWRQYVFLPAPMTEYSAGCPQDMASFLERVTRQRVQERNRQVVAAAATKGSAEHV